MAYWILKFLMTFALRAFYRRIHLIDAHLIPRKEPVILACNHANSFLDDFILGTLLKRQLHYLARSDVFRTKFLSFVLGQFYMLPIYRALEGTANVHKNKETFNRTARILSKKGLIMIHSEGICIIEKRLRPLKKGTARLAFQAEEISNFNLGLNVVPVTFNYTHATKFRKEVIIKFGEPFKTAEFKNQYEENPARAIHAFNERLRSLLQPMTITIEDDNTIQTTENLFTIFRNNIPYNFIKWLHKNPARLKLEIRISEHVNKLYKESKSSYDELSQKVNNYFKELVKLDLSDTTFTKVEKHRFLTMLLLIIGIPFSVFGYCANYLPVQITRSLTKKIIKINVFYASVMTGIGIILYLIYMIILIVVGLLVGKIYGLFAALLFPLCYFFYLFHIEMYKNKVSFIRFKKVNKSTPNKIKELKELRQEVVKMVESH